MMDSELILKNSKKSLIDMARKIWHWRKDLDNLIEVKVTLEEFNVLKKAQELMAVSPRLRTDNMTKVLIHKRAKKYLKGT